MEQNNTNIKITSKQRAVAEMLANPDIKDNKTAIMEKTKVSRATFYRWMRDDNFINYVNQLIDQYTNGELVSIWKSLLKQAEKGDTAAIKLFFELKGRYKQNIEMDIQPLEIKIDYGDANA